MTIEVVNRVDDGPMSIKLILSAEPFSVRWIYDYEEGSVEAARQRSLNYLPGQTYPTALSDCQLSN